MKPLGPLGAGAPIARALKSAPAQEVRAEIERLEAARPQGAAAAAVIFAKGALALREGRLDPAWSLLSEAADAFAASGEPEASALSRCEALLASIRRGPRAAYAEAIASLEALAEGATGVLEVVAWHYRGTAQRFGGDAIGAQNSLLYAFRRSEAFLEERAQVLNSLGTLYVVLGAFGAAEAMLAHAAELHHQTGDAVGEAISHGQLGSAALARGDLALARKHLGRQEWLASRVGDAFGQARALTFLADLALELRRPDDALELGERARALARSTTPPLPMWEAYATRAIGRALVELGDEEGASRARTELELAVSRFAPIGNLLGEALARWDLAVLDARSGAHADWLAPAWTLGSLGLGLRVTELLRDHAEIAAAPGSREAALAVGQPFSHAVASDEVDLVYSDPEALSRITTRRAAGQRNLGRLGALTVAPRGLAVAACAAAAIGRTFAAQPSDRASAALVGRVPGAAVWCWPLSTPPEQIARDLASLRAAAGEDARVVIVAAPQARVAAPPFAGDLGPSIEGDVPDVLGRALNAAAASLTVGAGIAWTPDAEALARLAGYVVQRDP